MRVISHHFLRRTARRRAQRLNQSEVLHDYYVVKAERGPYRWRVVQEPK